MESYMNYEKEVFKKHYGRIYIILCWVFLGAPIVFIAVGQLDFSTIRIVSALIAGISMLIGFPAVLCGYLRKRNQSMRQKQWIQDDLLYVKFVIDDGLTAGGFVRHEKLFTIHTHEISSIHITVRYIELKTNALVVERFNGNIKERNVSSVLIPRVFDNENIIINIGGVTNGKHS